MLCAVAEHLPGGAALAALARASRAVAAALAAPDVRAHVLLRCDPVWALTGLVLDTHRGEGDNADRRLALGHCLAQTAVLLGEDPGEGDVGAAVRALGVRGALGPSREARVPWHRAADLRRGALSAVCWLVFRQGVPREPWLWLWHALFQLVGAADLLPGLASRGIAAHDIGPALAHARGWVEARHGRERALEGARAAAVVASALSDDDDGEFAGELLGALRDPLAAVAAQLVAPRGLGLREELAGEALAG